VVTVAARNGCLAAAATLGAAIATALTMAATTLLVTALMRDAVCVPEMREREFMVKALFVTMCMRARYLDDLQGNGRVRPSEKTIARRSRRIEVRCFSLRGRREVFLTMLFAGARRRPARSEDGLADRLVESRRTGAPTMVEPSNH
jgi:hypothetical protein